MSQITYRATGGGGGGDVTQFTTDAGVVTPVAGNVNLFGGTGITTTGAGDTATFSLTDAPMLTLTGGNSGGAIIPDGSGNITLRGAGGIAVDGNLAQNSLTITSTGGGLAWELVTTATKAMAANTGYFANFAGPAPLEFTLPETCPRNRVMRIVGLGVALWTIKQNANQKVHFDNIPQTLADNVTTTGILGSVSATATNNCAEIICIVADTEFQIISNVGGLNLV